jgi:hypothetical protein
MVERTKRLLPRGQRIVVPEVPQRGVDLIPRQPREPLIDHGRYRQAPGEIGHQPARMRQNELDAGKALDCPGEDEVHYGARGVEQIFHHEGGPGQSEALARWVQSGMDERNRTAPIERLQNRTESAVPQKLLAVACKQRHPVEAQRVQRMADLGERKIEIAHWNGRKSSEPGGPARNELGSVFVAAAGKRLHGFRRAETDARLRQRGERQFDPMRIHDIERDLRRPIRVLADGRTTARLVNRVAIERRDQMKMHVDAARCSGHFAVA